MGRPRLRPVLAAAGLALALAPRAGAQPMGAGDPGPAFETAAVTPSTAEASAATRIHFEPGGRFVATGATLRKLVEAAYRRSGFDPRPVEGGPPWVDADRFDVSARAAGEHAFDRDGYPRQTALMLRRLLAERFHLKVRLESREQPAYALVMARGDGAPGPLLVRSPADCAAFMAKMIRGERPAGGPQCGFGPYPRRLAARAVSVADLAGYLSMLLKRPVLDRTGLTGLFDLEVEGVEVVPPGPPGPSTRPSETTRSIVEMLPEQLGLKLEESRGPVEVLVIEHAEKPAHVSAHAGRAPRR